MRHGEQYYSDRAIAVRVVERIAIVYHLKSGRYFELPAHKLPQAVRSALQPYRTRVSTHLAIMFTAALVALALLNLNISLSPDGQSASIISVIFAAAYTALNVVAHEGGHTLTLKAHGRRIDKIGVKLHYYVFPAFYVRMSQSILLSREERVVVHGSGVAVNLLLNSCLWGLNTAWWHAGALSLGVHVVAFAAIVNVVPILRSDGYRVLLAWVDVHERASFRQNVWWIKGIKTVSVVAVLCYTGSMLYQVFSQARL